MTFGSFWTSSMVPSASTLPSCSTVTCGRCCARTPCRARRPRRCARRPATSAARRSAPSPGGVMPATGSSTSSTLAGPAPAACRSPATASGRATAARPALLAIVEADVLQHLVDALALRLAPAREQRCADTPLLPGSASSRFSKTVWPWKTVGRWNLRPMPSAAISYSVSSRQIGVAADRTDTRPCRAGLAGDDVHQRGLAGAVGADDAAQLARRRASASAS